MQNLFLKKDYKTYLTVILTNTVTWEIGITLNDSSESKMWYLLLEPWTTEEESIFYHRRDWNTVYCYGVNRSNPVEHAVNAIVYMANSIDYMNYIISQTYEQTFIFKKSLSHVIITGGSFYIWGENIIIDEIDTSDWITNKTLISNANNYLYLKDWDYYISSVLDTSLMMIAKIITALDGTITSIEKYNTITFWSKWEKGDTGNTWPVWPTGPTGPIWATGLAWEPWEDWAPWTPWAPWAKWNTWLWAYSWATTYVVDDVVSYLWSSYICILSSTGNIPTNNTYWNLFAQKGNDWAGLGDMVKSTYDPSDKSVDVYSMDNMDETATKKILTDAERTAIATISSKENSANKSISLDTDQASDVKYPSVKSVFDWATWLFGTITNLNLKAPLASPIFTGNVTVPTPSLWTDAVNKAYADSLVTGLLDYRGAYDASWNVFPTTGWSWTAGAVIKWDMYVISVAGTLWWTAVQIGDSIIANIDTPGQTAWNWNILNSNISYVPEDVVNKATTMTGNTTSNILYLTAKAVFDWVTWLVASTTSAWIIEIATSAEGNTGTDATRAISPDWFAGSNFGIRYISFPLNGTTALTTSDKTYQRIPSAYNGMNLVSVTGQVWTWAAGASSSGLPTFTVKNVTDNNQMLSTSLTIDVSEYTSATAVTPPVINTAFDDVVTDDLIEVAVTTAGTGVTYAVVTLWFQLP